MLDDVLDMLRCPHGEASLVREAGSLVCSAGHRFDVARQGYVNLLSGAAPAAADTSAMVAARAEVVAAGLLRPLSDALAMGVVEAIAADAGRPAGLVDDQSAADARRATDAAAGPDATDATDTAGSQPTIVEVGSGPAQHLAAVVEATGGRGLAVDLSKHAARRAAHAHTRIGAVVADVWAGLPLREAVSDVVLVVFAPRPAAELARLLRPRGILVVVTPTEEHLSELAGAAPLLQVDPDKSAALDRSLAGMVELVDRREVSWCRAVSAPLARALVAMGPNAHHVDVTTVPTWPEQVRFAVTVSMYRRR